MKKLYKQIVNELADYLKCAPTYIANCLRGRYKAKRSEIPALVSICNKYGLQVSERDFLCGTKVSNNPVLRMFRSMHSRPKHDKFIMSPNKVSRKDSKILSLDF